jgi:hypothetical protein
LIKFSQSEVADACAQFNVLDYVFRNPSNPKGFRGPPKSAYVSVCLQIAGRLRARLDEPCEELTFPLADGVLP